MTFLNNKKKLINFVEKLSLIKDFSKIKKILKKNNFLYIGKGASACVFHKPNTSYVLKFGDNIDPVPNFQYLRIRYYYADVYYVSENKKIIIQEYVQHIKRNNIDFKEHYNTFISLITDKLDIERNLGLTKDGHLKIFDIRAENIKYSTHFTWYGM